MVVLSKIILSETITVHTLQDTAKCQLSNLFALCKHILLIHLQVHYYFCCKEMQRIIRAILYDP
jgi:hypothetical protein